MPAAPSNISMKSIVATCAAAVLLLLVLVPRADAYGPNGHRIVGAIADERLANTPTGQQIRSLIQGFSLERASVIPDEIKGWDKKGVDAPGIFRYTARPLVDEQLAAFWRANPPTYDMESEQPNHHWFHYTDVPIEGGQRYADGKVGRSKWDIVQMINYCVRVLRGDEPEDNPRKITKPIAVILLAHMVGDIHQPLHVGAQFFDEEGKPVDPEKHTPHYDHHGGNTIMLRLSPEARERTGAARQVKFHGFWDNQAVTLLLPQLPKKMDKEERRELLNSARWKIVKRMSTEEPANWRMPDDLPLTSYAEAWANEMIPVAREAHERLEFIDVEIRTDQKGRTLAHGFAEEKETADGLAYHEWAEKVVDEQLHRAGWRLADLLQKAMSGAKE
jgi:hypothetical protein